MGIEAVGAQPDEHYLAADDPATFAAAVIRCLEDAELSALITSAARQFVEDHFEWSTIGGKLDSIVKELSR